MIEEPCVHQAFYNDAIAIIAANSEDEALALLADEKTGWLLEDLRRLKPAIIELAQPQVIFHEVRGD
jgi:hypothetical protein